MTSMETEILNRETANIIKERVWGYQESTRSLYATLDTCLKNEEACCKSYTTLANDLKEFSNREGNAELREVAATFSTCLQALEIHRESVLVERLQETVVDRLRDTDKRCIKPTKLMIQDRENAIKAFMKTKGQYQELSHKAKNEVKLEHKKQKLQDEEKRIQNIDSTLKSNILKYERRRLEDAREVLNDLLRAQLFYHCRAIELLTKSAKKISSINSHEGTNKFANELHLHMNK